MKKRILQDILQYIGAIVLVAGTLLTIFAFEAGKLPFMSDAYLNDRNEKVESVPDTEVDADSSKQETVRETAASYIAKLEKIGNNDLVMGGIYGSDSYIGNRSVVGVSISNADKLDVWMGFLVVKNDGAVTAVYDSALNNVTEILNGYNFTFNRDGSGRPLFYGNGGYFYYENGEMKPGSYDKFNYDKGINSEYPSYEAGYNTAYTVFEDGGKFGLRKTSDGSVIIPAKFKDVYSVKEGYCVAVDNDNRLHLYSADGKLVTNKYFVTDDDGASSVGYYFVRNGLTRARTSDGKEVLLRVDGSFFQIPSGYEIMAYSDGVILLKGESGYGYMYSDGKWLCKPEYKKAMPFNEGLAAVCDKNGMYGMIDLNGETVVPHLFASLSNCSDGVVVAFDKMFGYYILNKVVK